MDCVKVATPNMAVNEATVGVPFILSPSTPRSPSQNAKEKPVQVSADSATTLTFKATGDADFVIYGHTLMLWKLASNVLTYQSPNPAALSGSDAALVRMRMSDSGRQRWLDDGEVHWAQMASLAGRPHRYRSPWVLEGGSVASVEVTNYSASTDFAVSMHLIGVRVGRGKAAQRIRETLNRDAMWREAERQHAQVTPDREANVRGPGVPAALFDSAGRATLATGTYAAPSAIVTRRITTAATAPFWVDRLLASIMVDGDTLRNDGLTLPIFARIFDNRRQTFAITDGWIPLGCLAGTAEYPLMLPQPWVGVESGTYAIELKSLYGTQSYVDLGIGGVYRTDPRNRKG